MKHNWIYKRVSKYKVTAFCSTCKAKAIITGTAVNNPRELQALKNILNMENDC